MTKNKKADLLGGAFLLMVILINVLIITLAYIINQDLYWAFLFLIPILFFAIYYKMIVSKKQTMEKKIKMNGSEFHGKDMVVLPRKIKGDELTVLFGNSHCSQPYLSSIICIGSKSADQNVIFRPKQIIQPEDNSYNHDVMQSLKDDLFINDSIWSIESGYADSIDHNFKFDAESFRINAERPTVKMIQLKLSVFNDQDNISTVNNSYSSAVYNKKIQVQILNILLSIQRSAMLKAWQSF